MKVLQSDTFAVKKGDVIAFYCNQSDWHAIWLLAVSIVGGVYTGNCDTYPQGEFHHLVQSSGAKFIIASERSLIKAKRITLELEKQVSKVLLLNLDEEIDGASEKESLFDLMREIDQDAFNRIHSSDWDEKSYEFLVNSASQVKPTTDLYAVNFSSGTTGRPKAVARTHFQAMSILNMKHHSIDLGGDEIVSMAASHFGHVGAMTFFIYALMVGGSTVLSTCDPRTWLTAASKYRVTNAFCTPSVIISLSRFCNDVKNVEFMRRNNFSSLLDILIAGEFLPYEISRLFLQTFPSVKKFRQSFGTTEMAFVTCVPKEQSSLENSLYSGIPMAGVSVKIERHYDEEVQQASTVPEILPAYEIGHILIKSFSLARYMNNEAANSAAFDNDGFFRTGDGGYYDDRGFLLITDRFKSIMKSDGAQVSPTELEDILLSHPSIREAVVIGIPHEVHGHVPRACVIAKEPLVGEVFAATGMSIKSDEGTMSTIYLEDRIKSYVAERVAPYKQLRGGVKFFTAFPATILGKVDRRFLSLHFSN